MTLGDSGDLPARPAAGPATRPAYPRADALGRPPTRTPPSGEAIGGCHRSKAAQAHIGGGVRARTSPARGRTVHGRHRLRPGLQAGHRLLLRRAGREGQALRAAEDYARTHNVRAVVVMIGANNYGFAAIVEPCVTNWLTSPSWWKNYCSDDSDMTSRFTAARIATETTNVRDALRTSRQAMTNAGYSDVAVHDPRADLLVADPARRAASATRRPAGRASPIGGCGVWNRDANWANDTVVPPSTTRVRNGAAQSGLSNVACSTCRTRSTGGGCARTASACSRRSALAWLDRARRSRPDGWVSQIRTATTIIGPYQLQRAAHASYWGRSRCATACGWPTTAARSAAAAACGHANASTPRVSRRCGLQ